MADAKRGLGAMVSRVLLLVHGQGDELATLPGCTGGCHQGDRPCGCLVSQTELSLDIGPSAERVIAPPDPLPDDVRARLNRRALYLSALGFSALAALLEMFGATDMPRIAP